MTRRVRMRFTGVRGETVDPALRYSFLKTEEQSRGGHAVTRTPSPCLWPEPGCADELLARMEIPAGA
jgi:hypothetical protein